MALNILLSTQNLCDIYQVNRSTIHRWVQAKKLPKPIRLGSRSPRWSKEQIAQFTGVSPMEDAA